jgi:hypothetical protein
MAIRIVVKSLSGQLPSLEPVLDELEWFTSAQA